MEGRIEMATKDERTELERELGERLGFYCDEERGE